MNYPNYDLEINSDQTIYFFTSNGAKGKIAKAIKYSNTGDNRVFNLGFGDIISVDDNGEIKIDDRNISDNGDRDVVLATVAISAYIFTETFPETYLFFKGSTHSRTRLYRIAITRNYEEISKTFHIFGAILNQHGVMTNAPFEPNVDYDGFIIKRKENESNR